MSLLKKPWLRRFTTGLLLLGGAYLAACVYLWDTQIEHVFEPSPLIQTTPERLGMRYDAIRIPVGNGAERGELQGWWVPSAQQNAPVFLYLHGNYRNIGNNLEHTKRLHDLGYNVFLIDYRGFGLSTGGTPNETKVYEDAEAAWQYLRTVRGLLPAQIFIYGHSLGGAIAIELASNHGDAAGLVTESTFTSMQAMGELQYGFLPVGFLLHQRFDSIRKVPQLQLPVLFIHGTWDQRVPVAMARQLYAAAPQAKTLLLIEGGEHNNSGAVDWVAYRSAVTAFVHQHQAGAL